MRKILRVHVLFGSLAWPVTMHGWLGPAQPHGAGWAQPENKKISSNKILLKKSVIFCKYFTTF
jgi:hypothetical protein